MPGSQQEARLFQMSETRECVADTFIGITGRCTAGVCNGAALATRRAVMDRPAPLPPRPVPRNTPDDRRHPCAEVRPRLETLEPFTGDDGRLLNNIGGVRRAHDRPGHHAQRREMLRVKNTELVTR